MTSVISSKNPTKEKYIIQVKNLRKSYGDFEAVKGISFSVKEGEIFSFLGPNGAGKSTTINILTTMSNATSGEILVDGYSSDRQDEIRKTFGIVFQDSSLDDELTGRENMYFHAMLYQTPLKEMKEKIHEAMKFVQLREFKDTIVKKYSGGMRRRLEIARELLHQPKILFLDEPTVGLDPQSRASIWEHLIKLNKEQHLTIFLTTHYMDEVEKISDRIAIMDHGMIQAQGSIEELRVLTGKQSMDDIFLKLTGKAIRENELSEADGRKLRLSSKRR